VKIQDAVKYDHRKIHQTLNITSHKFKNSSFMQFGKFKSSNRGFAKPTAVYFILLHMAMVRTSKIA
jgi:hypothetical protein